MKYCPTCGEELNGELKFCPNCGVAVPTDLEDVEKQQTIEEKPNDIETNKKIKDQKTIGTVILLIMYVLVAYVAFGAVTDFPASAGYIMFSILHISNSYWPIKRLLSLIPLLWMIPMTIKADRYIKKGKKFEPLFAVATLLFFNVIAGILMFAYNPNKFQK